MKVILLRDVKNIGRKYEVKEVNDGFARNGLIGKGAALAATPENLGRLKAEMDKMNKLVSDRRELLTQGLKEVSGLVLEFKAKANPEGHLFAAIHAREIAKAIEQKSSVKIEPDWIEPKILKTTGAHEITIKIYGHEVSLIVRINNQ
jgi:large subunit ribosomal protein L9